MTLTGKDSASERKETFFLRPRKLSALYKKTIYNI